MPSLLACLLLAHIVGRFLAMEASFNDRVDKLCISGSSAWTLTSSRSKTIVDTGLAVKAAESKQIDNFQLNLNGVSTAPTAPLKRLSCASLELWPCC